MKPNLDKIIQDNLDKAKFQSKLQPSLSKNTGWLDGYADGGLLSKKVTCSNCGWSWKAVDGGMDPMTCHRCGGMIKMKQGGSYNEFPEGGPVSSSDSLRHQAGKMFDFEFKKGSPTGGSLTDWGYHKSQLPDNKKPKEWKQPENPKQAVDLYMQEIANNPILGYFPSAMEKGEAGDFLYNTGRDARVYMLDQYLKSKGQAGIPNRGSYNVDTKTDKWTPLLQKSLDDQWNQYSTEISKLPVNTRRQLLNKGRDFYYQNTYSGNPGDGTEGTYNWGFNADGTPKRGEDGSLSPAYGKTWKPRIWESVNTYSNGGTYISGKALATQFGQYDDGGENDKPSIKVPDKPLPKTITNLPAESTGYKLNDIDFPLKRKQDNVTGISKEEFNSAPHPDTRSFFNDRRAKERGKNVWNFTKKATALGQYSPEPYSRSISTSLNSIMGATDAYLSYRNKDYNNAKINAIGAVPIPGFKIIKSLKNTPGLTKRQKSSVMKTAFAALGIDLFGTASDLTDNYGLENKKYGGWLSKYENGNGGKTGTNPPIIVNNPNDPRLKAYQDSLTLYNAGLESAQYLKNKGFSSNKQYHINGAKGSTDYNETLKLAHKYPEFYGNVVNKNGILSYLDLQKPAADINQDFRTGKNEISQDATLKTPIKKSKNILPIGSAYYDNSQQASNKFRFGEIGTQKLKQTITQNGKVVSQNTAGNSYDNTYAKEFIHRKYLPLRIDEYKKPVQPVVYKKEQQTKVYTNKDEFDKANKIYNNSLNDISHWAPHYDKPIFKPLLKEVHHTNPGMGEIVGRENNLQVTPETGLIDRPLQRINTEQQPTNYSFHYPIEGTFDRSNPQGVRYFKDKKEWEKFVDENGAQNTEERNGQYSASGYLKKGKYGGWLDRYPEGGENSTGYVPPIMPNLRNVSESTGVKKVVEPIDKVKQKKELEGIKDNREQKVYQSLKNTKGLNYLNDDELKSLSRTPQSKWSKDVKDKLKVQQTNDWRIQTHPDFDPSKPISSQENLLEDRTLRSRILSGRNQLMEGSTGNPVLDVAKDFALTPGSGMANLTGDYNKRYLNPKNSGLQNTYNLIEDVLAVAPELPIKGAQLLNKTPQLIEKAIPNFVKAGNIKEGLGNLLYNIPLRKDAIKLGIEETKNLRQVQEIGRLRATNKPIAEQMKYALDNNLPEEHFQKIFSRSKDDAQQLLDNGFGEQQAAERKAIRGRIDLRRNIPDSEYPNINTNRNERLTYALDNLEYHPLTQPTPESIEEYRNLVNQSRTNTKRKKSLLKTLKEDIKRGVKSALKKTDELDELLVNNLQEYPYYGGNIQEKVPSLNLSGERSIKKVSEKVGFAPENIQSGDVFTGSTNTSHSSYLPQLKQVFKYDKGSPQFLGYKPMNSLGFLSNYGYDNATIAKYLNTEIDEQIKRGVIPKNIQRPFLKGDHVILPQYGIKQHRYGGDISIPSLNNNWLSKYENGSVVDYLADRNQDFSYSHRKELAKELGIENYRGTAEQNLQMLSMLKQASQPKEETDEVEQTDVQPSAVNPFVSFDNYSFNKPDNIAPSNYSLSSASKTPSIAELKSKLVNRTKPQEAPIKKAVPVNKVKIPEYNLFNFINKPPAIDNTRNSKIPDYDPFGFIKALPPRGPAPPVTKKVNEKHWYDGLKDVGKYFYDIDNQSEGLKLEDYPNLMQQGFNFLNRKFGKHNEQVSELVIPSKPVVSKNSKVPPVDTPAFIRGKNYHLINDLDYAPELVDLNKINVGVRNRGDVNPIDTKGIIFGPVGVGDNSKDFKPSDTVKLKSNQGYVGVDKSGKIKIGFGDDFKNDVYQISPFKIIKDVTGFSKQKDDYELEDASQAQKGYFSPVLKTLKGDKEATGTLVQSNKNKNTYGDITGGHVIFTSPDFSKKIVVSGSIVDIENALENFKKENDLKTVNFVQVDNGTYNKNVIPKKGKLTKKDLEILDNFNHYGNNFIYMKKQGGQLNWLDKYK